ncbi:hypothetical protein AWC38_SpisGene24020 [Stylophora pistillata]|uniref:DED domain-containing protein n=1 Tax=Stylophora pistillata TaxID=50429 RepID=A0A2B4R6T3_STYPI|nr:hypothetical protein AWC38_SpisGene24020 [Stylophora pistillata]
MSAIEYSYLLIEISEKLDELSPIHRLLFTCRKYLASGSVENIQDTLSLFKELEEQQNLGIDNLVVIKELLKSVREWSLFGKVKRFENKRKEYNTLLEEIIAVLDELNDLERLVLVCRGKLSEESEGLIEDVRSLFKVLENQNILGLDRLDILKEILTETEKKDLLKDVEEFEERRNMEDEFERKKAQAAALASSVRNSLTGVVNIKTVFKLFAGSLAIVSVTEVLSGWSSYDRLVAAVQSCVLPAGTNLVQIADGCVCLTVQAETLSALTTLWKLYRPRWNPSETPV